MDEAERQELERLRAEVQQLRSNQSNQANDGLRRLATHAQTEARQYQQLLQGGEIGGDVPEVAYDAAKYVLQDMGLPLEGG